MCGSSGSGTRSAECRAPTVCSVVAAVDDENGTTTQHRRRCNSAVWNAAAELCPEVYNSANRAGGGPGPGRENEGNGGAPGSSGR